MHLKFPFLINFNPTIYSIKSVDDQIYLTLSGKDVYVPIRAILEKDRELIVGACKKAHAFWPKANIWNGESSEGTEEIARFLDILES